MAIIPLNSSVLITAHHLLGNFLRYLYDTTFL
nr:MAG TPA: hypothetical protein [Caudoviricetes sp.]